MLQASKANNDSSPLIGAFCSHLDSNICERMVDTLRAANFNIVLSIDREQKNEDQSDSISNVHDAVDAASVVLVFLSRSYSESKSCRIVLTFSSLEAKPLLPLIIEKDFEPVGWLGLQLAGHTYVRLHDDVGFDRFINDVKKQIGELLPAHIPAASDCEILAKFDSIIDLFDEEDFSKVNVDEICQSICVCIESTTESSEDPKALLSIAVEIFWKYNVIVGRIDDRFIELTKHTGSQIDSFLQRTLQNFAGCNPFVNDRKWSQVTFSRVFNSLATFPTTIYFLNEDFMLKNDSHARILFWGARILAMSCFERIFNTEQDAAKFPDQQIVLQMWLKYIDKSIQTGTQTSIVSLLLGVLQNLSASVSLVPLFVDACFPSTFLSWLSIGTWGIDKKMRFDALCTVYNFARHDKGAEALNRLGAIELLQNERDYVEILMEHPDASIVFDITLALLYNPENINDETLKIEPILKELLLKALSAFQDPNLMCGILPLSEFLLIFNTLFIVEELIKKSLGQTVDGKLVNTHFFTDMLTGTRNLDILTQTLLLNIIYRITSIKTFNNELNQNQAFLNKLKDLKDETMQHIYLPKHTVNLLIAANGILRNLGQIERSSEKETMRINPFPDQSNSVKKKVMVSYSHKNSGFCKALVNELQKDPQLKIWVDFLKPVDGDPWDHIAHAMEAADIVVCVVTKDYLASPSCMDELAYAIDDLNMKKKNALIPIRIGKEYKPRGGPAIRLKRINYVRFEAYEGFDNEIGPSDKDQSFTKTNQILRDRILNGKNEQQIANNIENHYDTYDDSKIVSNIDEDENTINSQNVTVPTKPVLEWAQTDIAQWLASIPVPRKLITLYKFQSVEELLAYARDLKAHEDVIYADIKEQFKDEYGYALERKYFVSLRDAFEQLLKNNQTTTHTKADKIKSSFCVLL